MITKNELEKLVKKYETIDFIKEDPIRFCHRYSQKEEIELAGFIASLFAYGNRKIFIKKLEEIFSKTNGDLIGYIKNGDFSNIRGVDYRFSKDYDIVSIFKILSKLYNESKGLEELFSYNSENRLQAVVDYFYSLADKNVSSGFYHMIPNPRNGGAMKRMNMYLRWMIRKGPVDLGIWKFMKPKDLLIPLDVHVARISREKQLLNRKSNDFKAVIELTNNLKQYCSEDPVKYDFALFGYGIELSSNKKVNYD